MLAQLKVHGDASQKSTYAYYFTEQFKLDPPVFPVPNWIVNNSADHGDDLPFVFGGVYLKGSNIVTGTHTLSIFDTLDTICEVLLCQKMLPNHTRMRSIITRTYLYVCFNAAFSPALCALHYYFVEYYGVRQIYPGDVAPFLRTYDATQESDKLLTDFIITAWTNFAKSG